MSRNMPFVLLATIISMLLLAPFMSIALKEILYGLSLSIKSIIVFLLPFIIFSLLFKAAVNLASNATKIILLILVGVILSSFVSIILSHFIGMGIYYFDLSIALPEETQELGTKWTLKLPHLIANNKAMFLGIILGIILGIKKPELSKKIAVKLDKFVAKLLIFITYLIPWFIAGFITKLQFDGVIDLIVKNYTVIFLVIGLAQFSYLLLVYFLLNSGIFQKTLTSLKNMLPAAISGFCTMSSAASMPLTIIGAEKNATNKDLAKSIIPATVNIHLVGDCFATPILAYAILKNYGYIEPSTIHYLIFAVYFILAKFSVAAIPGGGIIVMLPILEEYLGFNADMMSLITALYILFDPVITCANVLGNGAFAKFMDKIFVRFKMK